MENKTLARIIHREYGLQVERLTYLKQAWAAHCYAVDCATQERYFLKFYEEERHARVCALDVEFYLSLSYQLRAKQLLPTVACPVPTQRGRFAVPFDDHLLILFHWIEGQTVGFERLSDDVLAKLAPLVGRLHASTPQIDWPNPPRERFDIPFEETLRGDLEALEGITSADTFGQQELRRLLLPRRAEVLGLLDRLKELQAQTRVQALDKEMVYCHTDLHGGNLMLDDQGALYVVDWEGAWLAPPEHDLFFFVWEERFWDLFLPRYERAFRPVRLDSATFGFYFYRRNLEDLAQWFVRILHENNGEERDRQDLRWLVEDCIEGWPYLEKTIADVEARLTQRWKWVGGSRKSVIE
jgi:spectinomycin phosphotransferase